jgi:DnaJ-class molecular chaperone
MSQAHNNYYEFLELSKDASQQEIDQAYKAAKRTYSVSNVALYSIFSKDEATELNNIIEEAYTILSNPRLKNKYDLGLNLQLKKISNTDKDKSRKLKKASSPTETDEAVLRDGVIFKKYEKDSVFEEKIKNLSDCSGHFLKRVRQYKNISIDEVAQFSKISKLNIVAVEEQDLENLPSRVFIRGFALQISRLVGLNEKAFTDGYMNFIDEARQS